MEHLVIKSKFNLGDKVKVIKYGHIIWHTPGDGTYLRYDMNPELVGQVGIVELKTASHIEAYPFQYALEGIKGKHAWYGEDQLEMINKNPNYE